MESDNDNTHIVLTKGTMVAHYRIVDKIGAGGMGEVYLADDTKLKRQVALKFLPPRLCQDKNCKSRFIREAQAATKLNHPNIITVYEVGDSKGQPFIAMEYCRGETLREMLKDLGPTIEKTVAIALQICEGLESAHKSGMVHRNIKPSNIQIDETGRARILDFGLATVKGDEKLTKTGSTLGAIGYMSPEQVCGERVDRRSDLFSLGVILYEMITGKKAFKEENDEATMHAILNETPGPLARYKSDLPDNLQRLVFKLLEKDKSLRYQSAAGVISDLKRLDVEPLIEKATKPKKDWWNRYIVVGAVIYLLFMAIWWIYNSYFANP